MKATFISVISFLCLIVPAIAGPVGNPINWMEQPSDLTDLSQFPDHLFQATGRPVPADVVKAYGLDITPANTTGEAIFENDNPKAEWTTKCETSEGSPIAWHVVVANNWLRQREGIQCTQWHPGHPYCTELITFGSAHIGVCAEYHYWLWCESAAGFTQSLLDQCKNNLGGGERVGGYTLIRGWPGQPGFRGMMVY
ncbi:hypothetical protein B9Z19DRAFT_1124943 [Tuber borchii]|uniref:Uncharacterized protein n=1 Tax=Tuber borchii TaxID=42251 RepID=A0A2T6ZVS5_TUBBO|nr:hypothetical protein B9Z19DRAFT_1124943 [Tuber borchii]